MMTRQYHSCIKGFVLNFVVVVVWILFYNSNSNSRIQVNAKKPPSKFSFQLQNGNLKDADTLDPSVVWHDSTKAGNVDIEYGADLSANPTNDVTSIPKKVWARATTTTTTSGILSSRWSFSAKAQSEGDELRNLRSAQVALDANNENYDVSVRLEGILAGRSNGNIQLTQVEASKGFDFTDGSRISITPRYSSSTTTSSTTSSDGGGRGRGQSSVLLGFTTPHGTGIHLHATPKNGQELTISQTLNEDNTIAPTITSDGSISIQWRRKLSEESEIITNIRPNDSISIQWKEAGGWTTNVNVPIDGTDISDAQVSVKKDLNF